MGQGGDTPPTYTKQVFSYNVCIMSNANFMFILIRGDKYSEVVGKYRSKVLLGYPLIFTGEPEDVLPCIDAIRSHVESEDWKIGLKLCEGVALMDICGVLDTDTLEFVPASELVSRDELGKFLTTFSVRIGC